jgi:hypothetical protein
MDQDPRPDARFDSATPSIVKSIRQRDILNSWLRLFARGGQPPQQEDFRPERLEDELPDLVFLRVERGADEPRFVIESDGTHPADAHGSPGKGRYLDEYLGPMLAPATLIYQECCRRGRPTYTISRFDDIYGRPVDYERLLLPFSNGGAVDTIIASLKTISENGGFELRNLMRANPAPPAYKLRVVIDQGLVHRAPGRLAPGDTIELA